MAPPLFPDKGLEAAIREELKKGEKGRQLRKTTCLYHLLLASQE